MQLSLVNYLPIRNKKKILQGLHKPNQGLKWLLDANKVDKLVHLSIAKKYFSFTELSSFVHLNLWCVSPGHSGILECLLQWVVILGPMLQNYFPQQPAPYILAKFLCIIGGPIANKCQAFCILRMPSTFQCNMMEPWSSGYWIRFIIEGRGFESQHLILDGRFS